MNDTRDPSYDTFTYVQKNTQDESRKWVETIIAQAQSRGFYGKLSVVMAHGEIQRIVKEETLVPDFT